MGEESACNEEDKGAAGSIPGGEESHGQRSLIGHSP